MLGQAANPALQEAAAKTSELGLKLQQRDAELLKLRQMLSQEQAERRELLGEKEVMVAMAERQAQLESQLVEARELLAEYEKVVIIFYPLALWLPTRTTHVYFLCLSTGCSRTH